MDIAAWLRGLGLEQYAPAFRDNDVDSEVLPQLTVDDLISIGVTSVGHRRKLLAAIASLDAAASAAAATVAARDTPAPGRKWAGAGPSTIRHRDRHPGAPASTTVYLSIQIQGTSAAHLRREAVAWSIAPQLT